MRFGKDDMSREEERLEGVGRVDEEGVEDDGDDEKTSACLEK